MRSVAGAARNAIEPKKAIGDVPRRNGHTGTAIRTGTIVTIGTGIENTIAKGATVTEMLTGVDGTLHVRQSSSEHGNARSHRPCSA